MAVTLDLAGLVAYVDLCYEAIGVAPGARVADRRGWVRDVVAHPDPWARLDQMWQMLLNEKK